MSRNFYRRSKFSGKASGDLIRDAVDTLAELADQGVTDVWDGVIILVQGINTLYSYNAYDATADDGDNIIAPTQGGTGRWLKISFSTGSAGTGGFADKWVDVTRIPTEAESTEFSTVTVDKDANEEDPQEVAREIIDVAGTLDIINGYAMAHGPQDPNGTLLLRPTPTTSSDKGVVFSSDGSDGLLTGDLYYRQPNSGDVLPIQMDSVIAYKQEDDSVVLTADSWGRSATLILGMDTDAGTWTITLPSANELPPGKTLIVKDEKFNASNNNLSIVIDPSSSDELEGPAGAGALTFDADGLSVTIYTDGVAGWFVIGTLP